MMMMMKLKMAVEEIIKETTSQMHVAPQIAIHCNALLTICPRCCPRHAPDDATDMPLSIIFDFLKAPAFQNTST